MVDTAVRSDTAAGRGRNVADLLAAAAEASPDSAALISSVETVTWGVLNERVIRVAGVFAGLGLQPGDRVAVVLGNVPGFPISYFGALRAGMVVVPVNVGLTPDELAHIFADVSPAAVITSPEHLTSVRSGLDTARQGQASSGEKPGTGAAVDALTVPVLLTGVAPGEDVGRVAGAGGETSSGSAAITVASLADLAAASGSVAGSVGGGEDLAVVIYTSGTSGRPRGAMLSHRALLANLEQVSQLEPPVLAQGDVVLAVLPLFHIYGLNTALGLAVRHAVPCVLVERFEPVETLEQMIRHSVSVVVGAPPMYVAWSMLPEAERAFATVRLAISGAAPLPPTVQKRMLETTGHHIFEGYGLTETAPIVTTTLMSEAAEPGSIGRPLPGVSVRLRGEAGVLSVHGDDQLVRSAPTPEAVHTVSSAAGGGPDAALRGDLAGVPDPPPDRGQVAANEPWDDEDPSAEVGVIEVRGANLFSGYWPDGRDGPDDEGWWPTGDVAYADDHGDLHLVDRARELILVSGFNVYPREVEDVLDRHPAVAESAVIGIPHPYTGQSVKALVVLNRGFSEATVTAGELIGWASKSLARFKCPTAIEFVKDLPHTSTGKVSKGRLRELVRGVGIPVRRAD